MKKNDHERQRVEQEMQETLDALDSLEDVETGPFFYSRLSTQIKEHQRADESWPVRPLLGGRLATALFTAVVALNAATVAIVLRDDSDTQTPGRQEYVEAVADEYLLTGSSGWLDIESD